MSMKASFEWDEEKGRLNQSKHGVSFEQAQYAFRDPRRLIVKDVGHSDLEERYYCVGRVGEGVMTVRFAYRKRRIRIFGAGYWRKGRAIYEKENKLHR